MRETGKGVDPVRNQYTQELTPVLFLMYYLNVYMIMEESLPCRE